MPSGRCARGENRNRAAGGAGASNEAPGCTTRPEAPEGGAIRPASSPAGRRGGAVCQLLCSTVREVNRAIVVRGEIDAIEASSAHDESCTSPGATLRAGAGAAGRGTPPSGGRGPALTTSCGRSSVARILRRWTSARAPQGELRDPARDRLARTSGRTVAVERAEPRADLETRLRSSCRSGWIRPPAVTAPRPWTGRGTSAQRWWSTSRWRSPLHRAAAPSWRPPTRPWCGGGSRRGW